MRAHWFYYLSKVTSWAFLQLFFGKIKIIGRQNIPKNAALLFAPNHQGAFMDAMLPGTFFRRPMHFLTRADIFNKRTTPILHSLNMMAIYRIRDGIDSLARNQAVFDKCYQMLAEKKAILIFPEGNHNQQYFLRPLAKGTSRMALDGRERVPTDTGMYIIPVGINYFSFTRPLSKVILNYGTPINVNDYRDAFLTDKQKAYQTLREDLAVAMKETLIIPEEDQYYEKKRDWIFQPKHESKTFEELKVMGRGSHFEERPKKRQNWLLKALIAFFFLFNSPPLLLLSKVLKGVRDPTFTISIKYLAGTFLCIIWWSLLLAVGAIWISWPAGFVLVLTGIFTLFARQLLIRY